MANPIKGYRDLSDAEIAAINAIKEVAEQVGILVNKVAGMDGADQRWISIARTDLQKGFMALARAVAKPSTF